MTLVEDVVLSRIVSKLDSGELRRDGPVASQFSKGRDRRCAACGNTIKMTQVECATEFADLLILRFHRDCYYAWDGARRWPGHEAGHAAGERG